MSINQPVIDSTVTNATSGRRLWLMRVLALTLGCLPFLLLESLLWCVGWPPAAPALDPLVDLNHLQPLFERSADGQSYAIGPERYNLFRPAQFAARKPEDTFRIFALGGSTTQGEPYSTETAFPEWLRIYLQAASPGRSIEAINCGGLSYASYRVQAILTEVLAYSPDLIVIYTGQNEFLEQRSYAGWRDIPLPLARAQSWLDRSRVVQSIRWGIQGPADREARLADPTVMSREVEALLDYAGGLEAYRRSDPWREPVVAHFRWNVAHMVEQCQQAGVPVILMCPVVNLLDCPPMKFETRADLSLDDRTRFESAWQTAQQATDPQVARAALQTAQAIDPEHAGVHFFIGRLAWEAGQWDEAARWLSSARDLDVCPLRALSSMQTAVREIAVQYQVPLIDADQLFQTLSPHGLVGNQWLVDHVHPTIEGHQVLGEALCELVLKQGWFVARDPQWRETARPVIRQVLSGLGEDYFQRGKQRLEGLLLWTQGRAKKIRPQQ